ncbi:hypothetical protein K788_0005235 [Paraburkholderia caribensis MBA4]|uniref:Uncharacterized protein n=1 Tax=Paraburkholderia caribensis MBA4 TaxID=1323664 RepID=A0A0P0RFK8_9BURK|nr:hypothetical protein K788_0005235 [Paraburkholderia caribensis MBA4]
MARKPTHSLPPGRRRTVWCGVLRRGYMKRVRHLFEAFATHVNNYVIV